MLRHAAGAQVKGESPPRRPSDTAWEPEPGAVPPTRVVRPSSLCGSCAGRQVSFHGTVPPTPIRPPRRTPRKRTVTPSKWGTTTCPAPAQDVVLTSDQRSASPPPPPALCGHLHHCSAIPSIAASSPALWEPKTMGHCC
jgi:hypothetical protein